MFMELYRALIDQICAKCNIPNPHLMYKICNLCVNKNNFSLFYGGAIDPLSMLVYADFGALPQESREAVLLRLLETNMYVFGTNCPAFTYNPDNGHVLLMYRIPLQDMTADMVLESLSSIADTAADWRGHFFLQDEERQAGKLGKRFGQKGTADRLSARLNGRL